MRHRPFASLSGQEQALVADLSLIKTCSQCSQTFYEMDNMGRLRCKLHLGCCEYTAWGKAFFACCGATRDSPLWRGCRPCDHLEEELPNTSKEEREAFLLEQATAWVPTVKFFYGLQLPLQKCLLAKVDENQGFKGSLLYTLYPGGPAETLDFHQLGQESGKWAQESPLCDVTKDERREKAKVKLEERWKTSVKERERAKEAIKPEPYVIIRRL